MTFKIDTGADVTMIPRTVYASLPSKPKLRPTKMQLTSPGGRLASLGEFEATTGVKQAQYKFRIVVVDQPTNCLPVRWFSLLEWRRSAQMSLGLQVS